MCVVPEDVSKTVACLKFGLFLASWTRIKTVDLLEAIATLYIYYISGWMVIDQLDRNRRESIDILTLFDRYCSSHEYHTSVWSWSAVPVEIYWCWVVSSWVDRILAPHNLSSALVYCTYYHYIFKLNKQRAGWSDWLAEGRCAGVMSEVFQNSFISCINNSFILL